MRYGIVGAGKGALAMIWAFEDIDGYDAAVVCDINPDAPGMLYAQKRGIPTTTDLVEVCRDHEVDMVFELTGNVSVAEHLRGLLRPGQELVSAGLAKVIWDLTEAHDTASIARSKSVLKRIVDMSGKISAVLKPIEKSERSIEKLMRQTNIITINASIEAARLGQAGKAFAVIIGRLRELTQQVSSSLDLITQSSETIEALAEGARDIEQEIDAQLNR